MLKRREILATINATTMGTGYERVLAGDLLAAIQTDDASALENALRTLARVALTLPRTPSDALRRPQTASKGLGGILGRVRCC